MNRTITSIRTSVISSTITRFTCLKAFCAALILSLSSLAMAAEAPMLLAQASESSSVQASEAQNQLDINSADAKTLADSLVGIGLTKAQDIVAYREMYGNFRSIDELTEVKGIGEATLEKIRHLVAVVPQ